MTLQSRISDLSKSVVLSPVAVFDSDEISLPHFLSQHFPETALIFCSTPSFCLFHTLLTGLPQGPAPPPLPLLTLPVPD